MKSANAPQDRSQRQQSIERHYFEMFRKNHPLPSGAVIYGDEPDIILKGGQNIGVEIANFNAAHGAAANSEQDQWKRRESVVARGHDLYQQNAGKNIELTFGFDEKHPIENVDKVAEQLATLARRVEELDNGQIRKDVFEDIKELAFAYLSVRELKFGDELDSRFPDGQPDRNRREVGALQEGLYRPLQSPAKWRVSQSHDFGLMSAKRLTEIIKEREAKARQYLTCDVYWLLIVVDFIDSAQEHEIRVDGVTIESDVFQRIIVYKPKSEHILEVAPRSRTTSQR